MNRSCKLIYGSQKNNTETVLMKTTIRFSSWRSITVN